MSAGLLREAAAQIREDCPIPARSRGFDFIDFPTGFALQRAGVTHVDECSAAQTGSAMLCDCEAIYRPWRQWRTLLAVADWLEAEASEIPPGATETKWGPIENAPAVRVARAYLATP